MALLCREANFQILIWNQIFFNAKFWALFIDFQPVLDHFSKIYVLFQIFFTFLFQNWVASLIMWGGGGDLLIISFVLYFSAHCVYRNFHSPTGCKRVGAQAMYWHTHDNHKMALTSLPTWGCTKNSVRCLCYWGEERVSKFLEVSWCIYMYLYTVYRNLHSLTGCKGMGAQAMY